MKFLHKFKNTVNHIVLFFRLYKLQKEIQISIKKPNYAKVQSVEPGLLCLATLPDECEYNRALVIKTDQENALCLFVDFGDEVILPKTHLKYLDNIFIAKLPFQSIQCSLYGVKPVLSEWDEDATTILYDYGVQPQTDLFRSLFVKVCDKGISHIMNQNRYSVLLKDGYGERNVLINQLLIDCGFGSPETDNMEDFEIPLVNNDSDYDDELTKEEEMVKDIYAKTEEVYENFHSTGN